MEKLKFTINAKHSLLIIAFCCIINNTFSQNIVKQQDDYLPFEQIIILLESKHNVHFFYKKEWFFDKQFHNGIVHLSLEEAVDRIKERVNCSSINLNSSIIFVTKDNSISEKTEKGIKILQIGNSNELGQNSKAIFKGRILDGKTGSPLIGAILYIENLKQGATTDAQGLFNLTLPVGDHNIRLSYVGYEDTYQKIKLLGSGHADLEIFEKNLSIDNVFIYAEKPEMNITRTQMSVSKLSSRNIKELPVSMGEVDVIKSLTLLPGVQSVGEFGTGFNVRGGSSDQNLILIEDVPLFNSSHLFGLLSALNSDAINSVTLIKSGMPAKYGERVSSIMDIKMNQATTRDFKVKAGIGILNSKINIEAPIWKNRITLSAGGRTSYSDWFLKKMPDEDLMNSSTNFYDLNGLLAININSANKISIFGYTSYDKFDYNSQYSYNYRNSISSIKWYHSISRNLSFNIIAGLSNYSYQVEESDSIKANEAYSITSFLNYRMLKGNLLYTPNKNHSIEFGGNIFQYNINPGKLQPEGAKSSVKPQQINPDNAIEIGLYLSDNISITPKLGVELGVRFSSFYLLGPGEEYLYLNGFSKSANRITDTIYYSNNESIINYSGIEPRANIRYTFENQSSIKMSYSRINQYINLISNSSTANPSDVWKLSTKYIKPLISDQFALGYYKNFINNTIESSIEVYYKNLSNVLEYKNGAQIVMNPCIEADLINAKGYNIGLELYLKKNSGKVGGWISYTWSKSMRKTNGRYSDDIINNNSYFPSNFDKTHNLILNTSYYISNRWRFAATFSYNTGRPVTLPELEYYYNYKKYIYYSDRNKYRLPDYHRLDVSISYGESIKIKKRWKGSWTFSIINLYGRKNAYSVYYQKDGNTANLYKLYIIGRPFPSLTYNLSF